MGSNQIAQIGVIAVSVAGMAVAVYLTSVHYASVPLACSSSGVVNCEQVLHSRYSEVLGIPWSLGGIAWFAISGLLAIVGLRQSPEPDALQPAQVVWALFGLAVVFYLIGVELIGVKHICIWCTSMHVLILTTLVLVLFRRPEPAVEEA
ncbi:MAG TPA: vitamin K epoxide reductase family protein [Dehalococcoidia bacterium]|nr:vitamin K epoxide reductase family protein [Dehalococcoidia bacterium]